ncbi:hypothetical protein N8I71_18115 [Roseibacterium sp. SDUM158016]|uniref:hypothetical protein n=1 Tax=Roseicyclus sediminis TaxID=2980997 RepID=UPI0021CF008F|nr:hypothetical protein [Roseibacterium sp. SDUM158016]MCU4654758.1 hypothetical protein [Roseibacterium sp. SDUM158016]
MTTFMIPLAVFLAAFAALAGLSWLRRAIGEPAARRKGMALNLARRSGPPVIAGIAVLALGAALGGAGTGLPAAILVAGGLAWGFHQGLSEVRQANWRSTGLRALLAFAAATAYLWMSGLAGGGPPA